MMERKSLKFYYVFDTSSTDNVIIDERPLFVDIFDTVIGYVLVNDINVFYAINIGGYDIGGEPFGTQHPKVELNKMEAPLKIEHKHPIT